MTLLTLILIAIPTCILIILLWIYNDYRKYKKQHGFLLLLFWALPAAMQAQYVDKGCLISFKWHENQQGRLELISGDLTYRFIPHESFWEIIIRNNSSDKAQINWENAQFIVNGRASGVAPYPASEPSPAKETINGNSETCKTCTASILTKNAKTRKIYNSKEIRKGKTTTVSIVLPVAIANQPQFFTTFDFTVKQAR